MVDRMRSEREDRDVQVRARVGRESFREGGKMDAGKMRQWMGIPLVCVLMATAGCNLLGTKEAAGPATSQAIIPAPGYLPPDRAVDNWDRSDKIHHYDASNLYLTLGNDARVHKDYGVQALVQTTYRVGLEGVEQLDVKVFRMQDNVNAFGVYSVEHKKDAEPVEVGARGCASELTAEAVKGEYYVKLTLDKAVPDSQEQLVKFAGYIAQKLPGDNSLPGMLKAFPEAGRVANSEQFLSPAGSDRPYLKGGFRVMYEVDGKKFTMFLTYAGNPDEAIWTMSRFKMSFENTGSAEMLLPGPWLRAFWGLDPELGRAFVFQKNGYIGGTMGLNDVTLADKMSRELANALP